MRLDKISRRRFLKGAGAAALAVAAAGVLAGCDGNSSGNKVSPTPTPVTKEVTVKYVLDEATGQQVCTKTINVDVTKLDVTNPTINSSELALPKDFSTEFTVVEGDYSIDKNGDNYEIYVVVTKNPVATDEDYVTVTFYMMVDTGKMDVTDRIQKGGIVVTVPEGSKKLPVSKVKLPEGCKYEIFSEGKVDIVNYKAEVQVMDKM